MTEQEAQVWIVRLERIWSGQLVSPVQRPPDDIEALTAEVQVDNYRVLLCHVNDQFIYLRPNSDDWKRYHMIGYFDGLIAIESESEEGAARRRGQQFERVWLPIFRRGLWLSGCPIEASAHEKAEWMQGFSQEELEAWNLKM